MERFRPSGVLLENVPGLLSSHAGKDLGSLLRRLVDLGYGVSYRLLDARYFGVPQRRRRVFIVGLLGDGDDPSLDRAAERAASVLAVGTRCDRHPTSGSSAWEDDTPGSGDGAPVTGLDIAGAVTRRYGKGVNTTLDDGGIVLIPTASDASGGGAPDGVAGRMDDRPVVAYAKTHRATDSDDAERWDVADVAPTVNLFDQGDKRSTTIVALSLATSMTARSRHGVSDHSAQAGHVLVAPTGDDDDDLLPIGLDSHRFECCGNGVVAPVAEWVGERLARALRGEPVGE